MKVWEICLKLVRPFVIVTTSLLISQNVRSVDVEAQRELYQPDYSYYHNLSQLSAEVLELVGNYGSFISSDHKYKSRDGRSQLVLRISNLTSQDRPDRVKILLSFGEHAREFFPVESIAYFLKNLTKGLDKTVDGSLSHIFSTWVINNFDVYIIAMANPDGRSYIERTRNYCWRGTGSGVDINRNFDWNYGGKGSSKDPSDGEYRGSYVFSEPETDVYKELAASVTFDAFVSFHSGIRQIYIPFADTISRQQRRRPANRDHMLKLAQRMSRSSPQRPFKFGLAYELFGYTADGTSFDYMAGVAKIPFSLAVEMWGSDRHVGRSCFDEFNPPSQQLQREVELVHPVFVELLTYLHSWKREQVARKARRSPIMPLVRKKKDDSVQKQPPRNDLLHISQAAPQTGSSASLDMSVMYFFLMFLLLLCVVLAARHLCHLMRKKRVISLRSLSSTFSLFKSL